MHLKLRLLLKLVNSLTLARLKKITYLRACRSHSVVRQLHAIYRQAQSIVQGFAEQRNLLMNPLQDQEDHVL